MARPPGWRGEHLMVKAKGFTAREIYNLPRIQLNVTYSGLSNAKNQLLIMPFYFLQDYVTASFRRDQATAWALTELCTSAAFAKWLQRKRRGRLQQADDSSRKLR